MPSNPNKFQWVCLPPDPAASGWGGLAGVGTRWWQICLTTPSLLLPLLPALRLSWEGTPGRWAQIEPCLVPGRTETGWRESRSQVKLLAVGGRRPVRVVGRGGSRAWCGSGTREGVALGMTPSAHHTEDVSPRSRSPGPPEWPSQGHSLIVVI